MTGQGGNPGQEELWSKTEAQGVTSAVGDPAILGRRKIGMLCSIKCPGSVILHIYDLMRDLRNESLAVVSGFHSPMEKECLNILLRGPSTGSGCSVVICYARSLPARIPAELRKPIDDGRLLLLSAFAEGQDNITRASSAARNKQVAELGDALFIPYASPGGMVEGICRDAARSGKPIFTFDGDPGASLQAMGARAIPLSGAAVLLGSVPQSVDPQPLQVATNSSQRTYSVESIRRDYKRAYEKWTDHEEALLLKLHEDGKTRREIAQELQRQPSAISSRLRKIEQRTAEWPNKTTQE